MSHLGTRLFHILKLRLVSSDIDLSERTLENHFLREVTVKLERHGGMIICVTCLIVVKTCIINSNLHVIGHGVCVALAVLSPEHDLVCLTLRKSYVNITSVSRVHRDH